MDAGRRRIEDFLPLALRRMLPALMDELGSLLRLHSVHAGEDGSQRLLLQLADGQSVESVLLPRDGLCVSTQVGCAVGCVFCMTGRGGLLRQLGSAEIVAQVALARTRRSVSKVVFMGMGEPAHNLDAVLEAIDLLGTAGGIGHKNLVFSTVGDERVFERLPLGRVKPALALSLHSTQAERRARLLPRAPRIAPDELVRRSEAYARATGYPLQVQWTLLRRHQRRRRRDRRAGRAARRPLCGAEPDPLQPRRRPRLRAARGRTCGRDGAHAAPPRRAHQAAPLRRPGRAGRLRAVARAGRAAAGGAGMMPPPITDASAWTGPAMAADGRWLQTLSAAEVAEIEAASRALLERGADLALLQRAGL